MDLRFSFVNGLTLSLTSWNWRDSRGSQAWQPSARQQRKAQNHRLRSQFSGKDWPQIRDQALRGLRIFSPRHNRWKSGHLEFRNHPQPMGRMHDSDPGFLPLLIEPIRRLSRVFRTPNIIEATTQKTRLEEIAQRQMICPTNQTIPHKKSELKVSIHRSFTSFVEFTNHFYLKKGILIR